MSNKLGVNLPFVLEHIAAYGDGDIDSETIDVRFEDETGMDTGCDVDIREVCREAIPIVENSHEMAYTLELAIGHIRELCKAGSLPLPNSIIVRASKLISEHKEPNQ